ncbi:hypothetical protein NFHSH190041_15870 [Shewanella sp. NFH-SH190041]|uniref:hypothetical protein n=1 Tax=Shewanella sp. NFH-SH190041 TaxID=2950245 RepID=UPI0021C29EAA|nr:hypothetical protein [Shewanella sp. NFH-SH190041]BDM64135.1 hypothetical protein NFHSH190041_15870 [Shewanella sp. NFH-SH190041]
MSFDSLLTDTISVLKKTGENIESIKASVQKGKIFIQRSDILIESGDLIRRTMSNGATETYEVIDPGFHEQFHGIPAGYQMNVKNLGLPEAEKAVQSITYNISGTNNRVNQNSTDNSVNINVQNQDLQEHLEALKAEITKLDLSPEQEKESFEVIDAIESQVLSESPSKVVVKTLLNSLPYAGSIASIGSFILSLLV